MRWTPTPRKVQGGTQKIPGDTGAKISQGQAKVNAEASKEPEKDDSLWGKIKSAAKWVAEKLKAAFEFVGKLLTDPGFWVSLIVAVALAAFVIATFGSGLAVILVGGAIIGAISAGAGTDHLQPRRRPQVERGPRHLDADRRPARPAWHDGHRRRVLLRRLRVRSHGRRQDGRRDRPEDRVELGGQGRDERRQPRRHARHPGHPRLRQQGGPGPHRAVPQGEGRLPAREGRHPPPARSAPSRAASPTRTPSPAARGRRSRRRTRGTSSATTSSRTSPRTRSPSRATRSSRTRRSPAPEEPRLRDRGQQLRQLLGEGEHERRATSGRRPRARSRRARRDAS